MIRRAELADLREVVDLCNRFHSYSPWQTIPFDEVAMGRFIIGLIQNGVVFLSEEGLCAGLLNPLYFNPAFVVAVEMLWFAPKGGRELRKAFEEWAAEQGAQAVQFSALGDDRAATVARLFARAGYAPVETGFLKRID